MPNRTIKESVKYFNDSVGSQLVRSVREASLDHDFRLLDNLLDFMEDGYFMKNPHIRREKARNNAYQLLAEAAYFVDHPASKYSVTAGLAPDMGIGDAYNLRMNGKAMDLVEKILESKGVNIVRDVFNIKPEEATTNEDAV